MLNNLYKILKILVTTFILIFLFQKIGISSAIDKLYLCDFKFILIASLLVLFAIFTNSLRSYKISRTLKINISYFQSIKFIFIGQFFNQILPSSVGGDSIRIWLTHKNKKNNSLSKSTSSILCDRASGLLISCFLPFFSIIFFYKSVGHGLNYFFNTALFFSSIVIVTYLFLFFYTSRVSKFFKKISFLNLIFKDLRFVLFFSKDKILIFILSVIMQLLGCFTYVLIARSINVTLSIYDAFIVIPLISIISTIPLSLAGWGVREGAAIFIMKYCAISNGDALTISIIFGILQIFSSIPGLILFTFKKNSSHE